MANPFRKWKKSEGGVYYAEEIGAMERHLAAQQSNRSRWGRIKSAFLLKDEVKLSEGVLGIFKVPVDDYGNKIESKRECLSLDSNLIVNVGREMLRSLQAHTAEGSSSAGSDDLGFLAVGGGTLASDGSNNGTITPLPTDTALLDELTSPSGPVFRPLLSLTVPAPGPPFTTNLWSAQIGTTQLNSNFINNAGLFGLDNATLFSFRTFVNQTKDSGFVMEFRWSIIF